MARKRKRGAPEAASRDGDALTTTEAAILGLLSFGERSGYELSKAVRTSVGFFWAPARSGIYAVLPRLVENGFARRRAVEQVARPDKHVYRITAKGRQALTAWLESGAYDPDPARNPFLLKVFLGSHTRPEVVIDVVERRRGEAAQNLAVLREIERDVRAGGDEGDPFRYVTLRWGLEYYRAMVRWADATLRELRARADATREPS